MACYIHIMASARNGTLYVGVTNDLVRRVHEHRAGIVEGFTSKYDVKIPVHFEICEDVETAMRRETRLKEWPRSWKLHLIEKGNPLWRDLYEEIAR